jgi:hypothetical protein
MRLFNESPRPVIATLMDCGLWWPWKSGTRDWTELDRVSVAAVVADLAGDVLMLGVDGDLPGPPTDALVKGWLRQFCSAAPVPVSVVISVTAGRQMVFVQQHASAKVAALLRALRVDRHAALRRAYAGLGPASLESIADRL